MNSNKSIRQRAASHINRAFVADQWSTIQSRNGVNGQAFKNLCVARALRCEARRLLDKIQAN